MIDYSDVRAADKRLDTLIAAVPKILDMAERKFITEFRDGHGRNRQRAATITMFSGGRDSTVLAHLMRGRTDYYGHGNTQIGIEDTRVFVRETSERWGVPLIERTPREARTYERYVLEHGFPGPGRHSFIQARIKGSPFERMAADLVGNPYRYRVMFVAGRRFTESARRKARKIPVWETRRSHVWVSPIRGWTNMDMSRYLMRFRDEIPINPIAEALDMSGECLCGAFAQPGELDRLRAFPPAAAAVAQIESLTARAVANGVPAAKCVWGRDSKSRPCIEGCNL